MVPLWPLFHQSLNLACLAATITSLANSSILARCTETNNSLPLYNLSLLLSFRSTSENLSSSILFQRWLCPHACLPPNQAATRSTSTSWEPTTTTTATGPLPPASDTIVLRLGHLFGHAYHEGGSSVITDPTMSPKCWPRGGLPLPASFNQRNQKRSSTCCFACLQLAHDYSHITTFHIHSDSTFAADIAQGTFAARSPAPFPSCLARVYALANTYRQHHASLRQRARLPPLERACG